MTLHRVQGAETQGVPVLLRLVVVLAGVTLLASGCGGNGELAPTSPAPHTAETTDSGLTNVPDVRGLGRERALSALRNAKLTAQIEEPPPRLQRSQQSGVVVGQEPPPGVQLARGAAVVIYVVR